MLSPLSRTLQSLRRIRNHSGLLDAPHTGRNVAGRLSLEALERRVLLSVNLTGVPDWDAEGSQPMINAGSSAAPDNPASGAVEDVAIDPNDPGHMFAGTVNGGIWRTENGNLPFNGVDDGGPAGDDPSEQPDWTPQASRPGGDAWYRGGWLEAPN